jgi:predicted acetyltransferase
VEAWASIDLLAWHPTANAALVVEIKTSLVDVQAALVGRRYDVPGRLVFRVRDAFCPRNEGTYKLEGDPKGADCRRSNGSPDIALDVADLAACYLGGARFSTLWHAGRVEELTPGAVRLADRMFASDLAPWCPHGF